MGVSLNFIKILTEKKAEAARQAAAAMKQRKKEGFLGGLMSLAKPALGLLTKAGLATLNIGSGGLMTPLLMGLGTAGLSGVADKALRMFGFGADPDAVKATSKYGYGKESAKTISEGLTKSIEERDPWSVENIMADVVGSYVSAITPKVVPTKDGGFTIEGGELGKTIMPGGEKATMFGKEFSRKHFYPTMEKAELSSIAEKFAEDPTAALADVELQKAQMEGLKAQKTVGFDLEDTYDMPFEEGTSISDRMNAAKLYAEEPDVPAISDLYAPSGEWEEPPLRAYEQYYGAGQPPTEEVLSGEGVGTGYTPREGLPPLNLQLPQFEGSSAEKLQQKLQLQNRFGFEEGGKVPKYYGGGSVEGEGTTPTVADYFSNQGLTLGGSNKQSLAEMLGKK